MFDSGFGGLTVARALIDLLPGRGPRLRRRHRPLSLRPPPLDEVRGFAHQITRYLVDDHDVKLVVVACNTAAAAALDDLQATFAVPVVGVIEPGVRSLVAATRNGHVGVIGTVGTIGSGAYQRGGGRGACRGEADRAPPAPASWSSSSGARPAATRCTCWPSACSRRCRTPGVDTLLLGCTHYPYLARTISDVMGRDVVLVSSADETAFSVAGQLGELGPGRGRRGPAGGAPVRVRRATSTGSVSLGRQLLGPELDRRRRADRVWD